MASFVLKNAKVLIQSGTDVSSWCRSIRINATKDVPTTTAFGSTWHTFVGGLDDFSIDMEFNVDYAASVDGQLFNQIGNSIAVDIRADSAATSAPNPAWKGNVIVGAFSPLGNAIGSVATQTITMPGDGALNRTTS